MNISSVFLIASINIYFDSLIGGLLACILMWIVYGLLSAEIAILIVMKKRKFNRKKAIFAINFDNNKISLFSTKKYIFP